IHGQEGPGDILLFLTGEEEIDQMKKALDRDSSRMWSTRGELRSIPLYSSLPPAQQQRIFEPAPTSERPGQPEGRKCIIATNIAETSITIDGIVYVVDPGFSKQKAYNPRTRIESLLVSPISKASAKQRAGRAGRTQPGKCYRLYTQGSYETELVEQTFPEILRSNLGSVVLTLLKLGVKNLVKFSFMEAPAVETMMRALEELHYLGAIDGEGQLTPKGELMAEFPLDPQLASMLVDSGKHQCVPEMLIICAMLSVPTPFMRPRDCLKEADLAHAQFSDDLSDHYTLLKVYEEYVQNQYERDWCYENFLNQRSLAAAEKIRAQLQNLYTRLGLEVTCVTHNELRRRTAVRKGLCAGFFLQLCYGGKCKAYNTLPDNTVVALHPCCCIRHNAEFVIYHELVMTTKNYIRTCTEVELEWIKEIAPLYVRDLVQKTPNGEAKRKLMRL
ncbi:putative pre-mRNA splicing factor ATP-dependent RNA helicase, partial [Gregarina niphandrodes]